MRALSPLPFEGWNVARFSSSAGCPRVKGVPVYAISFFFLFCFFPEVHPPGPCVTKIVSLFPFFLPAGTRCRGRYKPLFFPLLLFLDSQNTPLFLPFTDTRGKMRGSCPLSGRRRRRATSRSLFSFFFPLKRVSESPPPLGKRKETCSCTFLHTKRRPRKRGYYQPALFFFPLLPFPSPFA